MSSHLPARRQIAIVGAGFSGTVLAARLVKAGLDVALIDRHDPGPGLAYGVSGGHHRLNVRSCRMSALPEEPDHFLRWLEKSGRWSADPDAFLLRGVYGLYLRDLLNEAERAGPGRLECVRGEAADLDAGGVRLRDGRLIPADRVVAATGNPAPGGTPRAPGVISDPWATRALDGLRPTDDVILLGCGLTMIDVVLELQDRGWLGSATALSRRGLTPRVHAEAPIRVPPRSLSRGPISRRLAEFRRRASDIGWREAMEELRPLNDELWTDLGLADRRRFLRHLRPWWDAHRHLLAPQVDVRVRALIEAGRLEVAAGVLQTVRPREDGIEVTFRPRGDRRLRIRRGAALIDCTGPDFARGLADNLFLQALLSRGLARADALGLGLETDRHGALRSADGAASERLFALGPPTRGMFWEITAVPDIRRRARDLAERLASTASAEQARVRRAGR